MGVELVRFPNLRGVALDGRRRGAAEECTNS